MRGGGGCPEGRMKIPALAGCCRGAACATVSGLPGSGAGLVDPPRVCGSGFVPRQISSGSGGVAGRRYLGKPGADASGPARHLAGHTAKGPGPTRRSLDLLLASLRQGITFVPVVAGVDCQGPRRRRRMRRDAGLTEIGQIALNVRRRPSRAARQASSASLRGGVSSSSGGPGITCAPVSQRPRSTSAQRREQKGR